MTDERRCGTCGQHYDPDETDFHSVLLDAPERVTMSAPVADTRGFGGRFGTTAPADEPAEFHIPVGTEQLYGLGDPEPHGEVTEYLKRSVLRAAQHTAEAAGERDAAPALVTVTGEVPGKRIEICEFCRDGWFA